MAGGSRRGAGRPKGVKEGKPRAMRADLKARLMGPNPTPLEVMATTMQWHLEKNRFDEACKIAEKLAPYIHAKQAPLDQNNDGKPLPIHLDSLTNQQLDSFIKRLQSGLEAGIVNGIVEGTRAAAQEPDQPILELGKSADRIQ